MNRKNTIVIAVLINAGLLTVLLVAALTMQDEGLPPSQIVASAPAELPKFDDVPVFAELPRLPEPAKPPELPLVVTESEPLVHKLPALVAEAPPALPPAPIAPAPVAGLNEIVVKKGDTLEKIAKNHRTTVDEILKINQLPSSFLKIGQVVKIPAERALARTPEKRAAELGPEYYTMKVGDNPWAIAMKHHMKVEELLRLNGLNEERARKLKPGDRLRIR